MTITLKHEATCADCKAVLPAGTKARWYRDGTVYGNECHRWRVEGLSPRQQRRLARVARAVLEAARKGIPATAQARIAALGNIQSKTMDRKNYGFLIAELRSIEQEILNGK